ncbi:hypothetical protein EYF80_046683 [Liparis tanakae]|uniref:Uncharacterized protein n=1 Tax=Liparis tanakae TaxID=230148 RepID=A0A4Z2FQ41_9TELE|nr:hypothetical protein EYF80_046683 [Liparis tanakae]
MNQRVVHARTHTHIEQVNVKRVIRMLHVSFRSTSGERARSSETLAQRAKAPEEQRSSHDVTE